MEGAVQHDGFSGTLGRRCLQELGRRCLQELGRRCLQELGRRCLQERCKSEQRGAWRHECRGVAPQALLIV
jgi:hypothetical protein